MTVRTQSLGAICRFVGGGTPSRKRPDYFVGDIPWVTVKDFKAFRLIDAEEHVSEIAVRESAANLVEPGTVLLVSRVGLGKVAIADRQLAINQDIKGLIPSADVLPDYLLWFLLFTAPQIKKMGVGATVKGVTLQDIKSIEMPVPRLPEQRRIINLLSRAERIVRLRREAQAKVQTIIPALFLDLFGDAATNPKGWPDRPLGELLRNGPTNGLYKHKSAYGSGTPILRIDAFYDGKVRDLKGLKRVALDGETERERFALAPDDIVINRVNSPEYLGKSAIIPPLDEPVVYESNMMRFAVDERQVLPGFVIALLQQPAARRYFLARAKHAINQSSINQQDVKSLPVSVPPLVIQTRFVAQARALQAIIARQTQALQKAEATFQALLARAFT